MTLADIVGVMSGPDRVRIMKGKAELYAGYLGNMGNVKVSAEEVESYDIEECTAILNAYMEFVDELKANPN